MWTSKLVILLYFTGFDMRVHFNEPSTRVQSFNNQSILLCGSKETLNFEFETILKGLTSTRCMFRPTSHIFKLDK